MFLLEYRLVGQAVYGDGRYYWAFTRSLYFSQNIDISSEMVHFYSPESNNRQASFGTNPELAGKTKEITHSFSLGISVIWLPFYLLADAVVVLLSALGIHTVRNGYSDIYQIIVGFGNIVFIVLGNMVLFSLLRRFFTPKVVMTTIILGTFATHLFYYGGIDVNNSHPFSFFAVSSLLWFFFKFLKEGNTQWLFLQGVMVGLLAGNRTQDGLFLSIPLLAVFLYQKKNQPFHLFFKKGIALFIGTIVGYLPQLLLLWAGQGELLLLPHTNQKFTFPVYIFNLLLDPKLGLLLYVPLFVVGAVGLWWFRAKQQPAAIIFLVTVILHYLLIASWESWQQASYSMRYFISLLPLIFFGLASVTELLYKRFSAIFVYVLIVLFVVHQLLMIMTFKLFWQDPTNVGGELSRSGKLKTEILQKILPSSNP
jgi:hypothetical protein